MQIKAIPTRIGGNVFDSQFESVVYQTCNRLATHYSLYLERQHPVLVKPATRRFPPINWKSDFRISRFHLNGTGQQFIDYSNSSILIEAKGTLKGLSSREFIRTLKILEYLNPSVYEALILVCQTKDTLDHAKKLFKGITACIPEEFNSILNNSIINLLRNTHG
jgi:hypothetical protein